MAPTPSSKSNHQTHSKTPQSKHRLHFNMAKPSPNPNSTVKETDHPVEVIGRIRDYPDRKDKPVSALHTNPDRQSLRVRTEIGYRDFQLDGVSLSEEEDLDGFYRKFVESRINGVKLGAKCTVMMYGPTGSGKSHTMFGCAKQQGIVYRSLRDILGDEESDENDKRVGTFVQVTVLEIYNEEIYDLLSTNGGGGGGGGGFSLGWSKGGASKVRLEVMGKKAKNATFISGNEAGKISKEIQKVEKRRIVKSTLCNERSSRSHCMIILDVPTVGGRLMLVDMAGSENIEQAGQTGLEAKMQTGKINQGNIALKRVVESIANGDSHVPFRDSKLTMLLQDSFEDDKSKILMILCASPDPKEMYKTISTLEYGAKAKCIVRGPHTPIKDKIGGEDSASAVILGSRISAMDQFIFKLQTENKLREKERNEAHKELMKKEEEISALREKLAQVEGKGSGTSEEEINLKVNERTQILKLELEKKVQECQKMANAIVDMERRKMEERILQQQQEVEMLRRRLEEIELELRQSRNGRGEENVGVDGNSFAKRLLEIYADEDPGMEKSMDLSKSMDVDIGRQETFVHDTKYVDSGVRKVDNIGGQALWDYGNVMNSLSDREDYDLLAPTFPKKVSLSTVFEGGEEEVEEENNEKTGDEEVQKEVIEEKTVCAFTPSTRCFVTTPEHKIDSANLGSISEAEDPKESASSRRMRIQNIFTLCGNYRELSQNNVTPIPAKNGFEPLDSFSSPVRTIDEDSTLKKSDGVSDKHENKQKLKVNKIRSFDEIATESKENYNPLNEITVNDTIGSTMPTREKDSTVQASKNLSFLHPKNGVQQRPNLLPFSPLENKLSVTPNSHLKQQGELFSPKVEQHLSSTPFITMRRR